MGHLVYEATALQRRATFPAQRVAGQEEAEHEKRVMTSDDRSSNRFSLNSEPFLWARFSNSRRCCRSVVIRKCSSGLDQACCEVENDSISITTGCPIPPSSSGALTPSPKKISRRFRVPIAWVNSKRATGGAGSCSEWGRRGNGSPFKWTELSGTAVVIATRIRSSGVIPVGALNRRRNQTGPVIAGNRSHSSGSRSRFQVHACSGVGVGTAHSQGPCNRIR